MLLHPRIEPSSMGCGCIYCLVLYISKVQFWPGYKGKATAYSKRAIGWCPGIELSLPFGGATEALITHGRILLVTCTMFLLADLQSVWSDKFSFGSHKTGYQQWLMTTSLTLTCVVFAYIMAHDHPCGRVLNFSICTKLC